MCLSRSINNVLCVCPDPSTVSLCFRPDPSTVFFVFVQIHQQRSLCLSRSINNVLCVCPDSLTVLFVFVQAQQCSFCLSRPIKKIILFVFIRVQQYSFYLSRSIKNGCSLCLCRSNNVHSVFPDPSKMNVLCVCADLTMFILFVQVHQQCSLCLCRSNKCSFCLSRSINSALCVCTGPTMFILFVQVHQQCSVFVQVQQCSLCLSRSINSTLCVCAGPTKAPRSSAGTRLMLRSPRCATCCLSPRRPVSDFRNSRSCRFPASTSESAMCCRNVSGVVQVG